MIQLRGKAKTEDARLDRVYELDWRSLSYLAGPSAGTAPRKPRSYTWKLDSFLDQGSEGSCVGHGYAHELAATPVPVAGMTHEYAVQGIYWPAQKEDPWDGGSYPGANPFNEGTSVLTGAKICKDKGYYSQYNWAMNAQDIAEALGYKGPVVLGVDWWTGMFGPDLTGFLHVSGKVEGGHCICAIGVKIVWKSWFNKFISSTWENVDKDKSYVLLHNSWGPDWGMHGRAKLSLSDLDTLMKSAGEACVPVRTSLKTAAYSNA